MTSTDNILASVSIQGLDIAEALGRLANNSKVYMRIIHSFILNMPKMLDELAAVTEAGLHDYSILVHGVKGSCYGIGAVECGDAAFSLEKASKVGDWAFVSLNNHAFISCVYTLIDRLTALEQRVESAQAPISDTSAAPDMAKLAALLEATRLFDIETMLRVIEELESFSYTSGGELVPWLREQFDNFAYDNIVERLSSL